MNVLTQAAIGQRWQEELLALFWAVQMAFEENRASGIPQEIAEAYERAEAVRRQL